MRAAASVRVVLLQRGLSTGRRASRPRNARTFAYTAPASRRPLAAERFVLARLPENHQRSRK